MKESQFIIVFARLFTVLCFLSTRWCLEKGTVFSSPSQERFHPGGHLAAVGESIREAEGTTAIASKLETDPPLSLFQSERGNTSTAARVRLLTVYLHSCKNIASLLLGQGYVCEPA